jgi:hypothetical protein
MDEACRWRDVQNSRVIFLTVTSPIRISSDTGAVCPSLRTMPGADMKSGSKDAGRLITLV